MKFASEKTYLFFQKDFFPAITFFFLHHHFGLFAASPFSFPNNIKLAAKQITLNSATAYTTFSFWWKNGKVKSAMRQRRRKTLMTKNILFALPITELGMW